MTEQELNKLIHDNEQLNAFVQDWWDKSNSEIRGMILAMIQEQKNLNQHLNNHIQVIILILANLKISELFQESERRKRDI